MHNSRVEESIYTTVFMEEPKYILRPFKTIHRDYNLQTTTPPPQRFSITVSLTLPLTILQRVMTKKPHFCINPTRRLKRQTHGHQSKHCDSKSLDCFASTSPSTPFCINLKHNVWIQIVHNINGKSGNLIASMEKI